MNIGEVRKAKLIDIAAKKRWALNGGPFGSKLTTKYYTDSGVPVIRGANLSGDSMFSFADFVFVSEEKADELRPNNAHPGDLIFTQRGTIGQVGLIPRDAPFSRFVISQSQMKLTPDPEQADARFLYYFFTAPSTVKSIENLAFAAGVPHINLEILRNFEVTLPPLAGQRRIAEILSAYDELIENNHRRIRILEEMARALYREWFVEFRFPGFHKLTRAVSSLSDLPQGWEVTDLAKVCVEGNGVQTGPFGSQLHESDYSEAGVPVVMPKDLISFRIRTDTIARIPEETADKLSRHRMQPGDIVYGRRGDIGRRAFLMPYQVGWFCGTGCLRIRPNPRAVNGWYLFNYLGQDDVVGLIAGRAQGVTMPNLNTGVMSSVPVKLPTRKLQDDFARLTFPMAEAREALTAKIENLRRTRDLLLPRLIAGQWDIQSSA
jgi:type I restriction enzyme, S subunit